MYGSLREYIDTLERHGELLRVGARVSPRFEIAEITDRMAKSEGGGKALLFENTGTEFPVLTNMMGSDRRMALALGAESLDDIARRIDSMLGRALAPKGSLVDKLRMLPLLADMSRWFPREASGPSAAAALVGARRRAVRHAADGEHGRSRERHTQRGHVPHATIRRPLHGHALAHT